VKDIYAPSFLFDQERIMLEILEGIIMAFVWFARIVMAAGTIAFTFVWTFMVWESLDGMFQHHAADDLMLLYYAIVLVATLCTSKLVFYDNFRFMKEVFDGKTWL
jgi:hypothetical protein